MHSINFQLVTPEKTVPTEELISLTCPTTMGEITILSNHVPLVATLVAGELHAKTQSEDHFIFVAGGFVEVKPGSRAIVLADAAEHHYEVDVEAAEQAAERARKTMAEHANSSPEFARVSASLQQSLAKIQVARKHAHRKTRVSTQGRLSE